MPTPTGSQRRALTHFSPNQVRQRLRQALREVNGRGGGTILRAIIPVNGFMTDLYLDHSTVTPTTSESDFNRTFRTQVQQVLGTHEWVWRVEKISHVLEHYPNYFCLHNQIIYVLRTSNRDIDTAKIYPVHIGNPSHSAVVATDWNISSVGGCEQLRTYGFSEANLAQYGESISNTD